MVGSIQRLPAGRGLEFPRSNPVQQAKAKERSRPAPCGAFEDGPVSEGVNHWPSARDILMDDPRTLSVSQGGLTRQKPLSAVQWSHA